jgi:hypothetical protein
MEMKFYNLLFAIGLFFGIKSVYFAVPFLTRYRGECLEYFECGKSPDDYVVCIFEAAKILHPTFNEQQLAKQAYRYHARDAINMGCPFQQFWQLPLYAYF